VGWAKAIQATVPNKIIPMKRLKRYIFASISLECSLVLNNAESVLTRNIFRNHKPVKNPKIIKYSRAGVNVVGWISKKGIER
jgi:hypothetical protein